MKFNFGKSQLVTSKKMAKFPWLAKFVYTIFGYTNIGNYARAQVVQRLLDKLPLTSFRTILDLGCGYGEFSFMMAEQLPNAEFTALDIDQERIEKVKKTIKDNKVTNISTFENKIESMKKSDYFDFIFSIDVFEHIYENDMPFKECFKKLKSGGYLLVKIPNITQRTVLPQKVFKEHNKWLEEEHVGQVYDLEGLSKRFIDAGFRVEHKLYSDGLLSRIAWEVGYLTKKGGTVLQLLFMPLCKGLILIDRFFSSNSSGNAIQVIGQKP